MKPDFCGEKHEMQCVYVLFLIRIIQRFMANRRGKSGISDKFYFLGFQKSLQMVIAVMKLKDAHSLEEKL